MMRKHQMKMKILLPVAATMVALAVFTGGAVMAQENPEGTGVVQSFASRVAAILGLNETDVQNAMEQARTEMHEEATRSRLDSMVEQGRLTQQQADQYYDWLQSRPEGVQGLGGRGFGLEFGGHGQRHGRGMKGPGGMYGHHGEMPGGTAPSRDGSSSGTGTSF
jgi:hypothetical protein